MAESVLKTFTRQVNRTVVETLQSVPAALDVTVTNDKFNKAAEQYTPTTTVPCDRYSGQTYTISGGLVDIDLTALDGTQDNVNGTGKKLQHLYFKNKSAANSMNIAPGAANAYSPFGAGNDIDVPFGGEVDMWFNDRLADIAAGVRMIRITGTNGDTFDLAIVVG